MKIWRMCITCWIPKATNPHAEYVILIDFPLQQLLQESTLNVTLNVHCMVCFSSSSSHYTLLCFQQKVTSIHVYDVTEFGIILGLTGI
jgi:hypothetical protein